MKLKINIILFFIVFTMPFLVLAKDDKTASPRVVPTDVQKAYDVKWYFLNLNAENTSVALSGDVTIRAEVVWNVMDYSIYATIPQTGSQLLIQNYIYDTPQCLATNKAVMDETKDMIEFFSEIFGEYPFSREKYGHALANISGGMEHQTMTTMGYFNESIMAHELVHQWFTFNLPLHCKEKKIFIYWI